MESKSQWYYENQGRAEGPISTLDLVHKIREGELSLLDLIFKEGEGQWMPAEHFPEIKNLIKMTPTQFKADSDWIVLRTVEVDGRDQFEQIGPFTIEQVLQLIDKGRIKFTDFVWRNGYENWVPLGQVDQFENPLESSVQVDLSIYEKPRQEDLYAQAPIAKNYKPAERIHPSVKEEPKPVEAKGEDLARAKWEVVNQSSSSKEKVAPQAKEKQAPAVEEVLAEETENTERFEQRAIARGRWQAVASILVIFVFMAGAGLFFVYGQKAYQTFQNRSQNISFEPVKIFKKSNEVSAPKPKSAPRANVVMPAKTTPVVAKQSISEEPKPIKDTGPAQLPVVAKNPAPMPKPANSETDFSQMTVKQKSYFINRERMFLFYQAQKGYKLVVEINKTISKPDKKKNALKTKVDAWLKQVQVLANQIRVEAKETHLYPDFFKRLVVVSQELDERGREAQSQLANGRGPSKEFTLKEIEAEFKKIMMQAKDLD